METSLMRGGAAPARTWGEQDAHDSGDQLGRVRIARRVLRTVVREAAVSVPGVASVAHAASAWASFLGRERPRDGVALAVRPDGVAVDLYLIVEPGINMVTVGEAVQDSVGNAIAHILGMRVAEINVYIRDVA